MIELRRLICVYENRPLTTDSMFAVPRIASQLLEQLARRHDQLEIIAASPAGGSISGVRSVAATADRWTRWQSRMLHSRWAKPLPLPRTARTTIPYGRAALALKRLAAAADETTAVLSMTFDAVQLARQISPRARSIYWIHSLPRVGDESRAVAAINAADAVVVPSQAIYQALFALVCRNAFQPPVWVIPNFIDEQQFSVIAPAQRLAVRRRFELGDDELAIMHVGRAPEKGLQIVRTALALCEYAEQKLVLISVGGAATGRRRIGPGKDILEIGRVGPAELNQLYQACDLGVVPSVWWENCPLALLEMMSLGLCVVASRVGGIPEMIEHEKTGLLVDAPNDVRAWACALDSVLASAPRRQSLGRAAKAALGQRFSADQFIRHWEMALGAVATDR